MCGVYFMRIPRSLLRGAPPQVDSVRGLADSSGQPHSSCTYSMGVDVADPSDITESCSSGLHQESKPDDDK
jgi:hypothetical protein